MDSKPPPSDRDAEMWVLGSILINPDCLDDLDDLAPADFWGNDHAGIFAAMREHHTAGKPIDIGLLQKHILVDDWVVRLGEIMHSVPHAGNVTLYADIVRELSTRRRLMHAGIKLADDAVNSQDAPGAILERSEGMLATINSGNETFKPTIMADVVVETIAEIDAAMQRGYGTGLATGLINYDTDQGGLFPGELIILAARPGIGKSSLAMQWAYYAAERERLTYFASLEMSRVDLMKRIACSMSGVSSRLIRTNRLTDVDYRKLNDAFIEASVARLYIHDKPDMSVNDMRRQVRRLVRDGLRLVVVDYLQLVSPDDKRDVREQQVAKTTKALKQMAREFKLPVMLLCQLNRMAATERPQLHHLRESGSIEQNADVVLFLYPTDVNNPRCTDVELIIAKNRSGEIGTINLTWHPSQTRFTPREPSVQEWTGA